MKLLKYFKRRERGSKYYYSPKFFLEIPPVKGLSSQNLMFVSKVGNSYEYSLSQKPPTIDVYMIGNLEKSGKGECWSNWNQGLLASNGRFYFAIGNHVEYHGLGNSEIYEYDPLSEQLKRVLSIRDVVSDPRIAAGKIHGSIFEDRDGKHYLLTYWGEELKGLQLRDFFGSALLTFDPRENETRFISVPFRGEVFRAVALDHDQMVLFLIALPSRSLIVYDLSSLTTIYQSPGNYTLDDRHILLDQENNAIFSLKGGRLGFYESSKRKITIMDTRLPDHYGDWFRELNPRHTFPFLRFSLMSRREKIAYGMTNKGRVFSLDLVRHTISSLKTNFGKGEYVASFAMSPDEKYLYYVPGSLGRAFDLQTPVVQYRIKDGRKKILGFLRSIFLDEFKYKIGGCYSISIDEEGKKLYMVFNGAPLHEGADYSVIPPFGQPCFLIFKIPDAERM